MEKSRQGDLRREDEEEKVIPPKRRLPRKSVKKPPTSRLRRMPKPVEKTPVPKRGTRKKTKKTHISRRRVRPIPVPEERERPIPKEKPPAPRRRVGRKSVPTKKVPVPRRRKPPVEKPPAKRRKPRSEPPEILRPRPRVSPRENEIVVYTVLFGNEDRLWTPHPSFVHEATFVVFTEKPREEVGIWVNPKHPRVKRGTADTLSPDPVWQQRIVELSYDNRKSARYYKILIPELFDEYEFSIWVDGNVRLAVSPLEAVESWLGNSDIAVIEHLDRTCLYDEAKECISAGKGHRAKIAAQTRLYRKKGMPEKWGLPSTRCVVRRHNDTIAQLDENWWREIEKYSVRDQISLPYVAWRLGIRWNIIPSIRSNAFWFIRHKGLPK